MKRTFNYTGRKKIPLSRVTFSVYEAPDGVRQFDADLNLHEMGFSPAAKVYVEAFYERFLMRFDFGTVSAIKLPTNRRLHELNFGGRIQFRVKVVDEAEGLGKLVGSAEGIVPQEDRDDNSDREAIFPVSPIKNMGQEVWRVTFPSTGGPELEVNADISDIMQIVKYNRTFAALVFPQALRQVLFQALMIEGADPNDLDDSWASKWFRFVGLFFSTPATAYNHKEDNAEDVERWISDAVSAFSNHLKARDQFVQALQEEM